MIRSRSALAMLALIALVSAPAAAGDVSAVLKGGKSLVITGSESDDALTITNFVTLTGDGDGGSSGDDVAITPAKGTTVNGSPDPVTFSNLFKLKLLLDAGADTVDFTDFNFEGTLTLRGDTGAESITFTGSSISGAVKLFGEEDDDSFAFDASNLGVTNIKGETGVLTVTDSASNFESLKLTGGPGDDVLTWTSTSVSENIKVNMSFGNDAVTFSGVSIGEDSTFKMSLGDNSLTIADGTQFGALVSYKGGPGADTLDLSDSQVGETLNVKLGPGLNSVTIASVLNNMEIGQSLIIKGGPQDDTVTLDDANGVAFPGFGIGEDTKINVVAGVNSVMVQGFVQFGEDLSITSGALDDTIAIDGAEALEDIKILVAAGNNVMTVLNTLADALTITAGSGDDSLDLTGTTISGEQKINLGGGNNTGP